MKLYVFEAPSAPDETALAFDTALTDLAASGLRISRHDLVMEPEAIAAHPDAADLYEQEGSKALPIIAVDDVVMSWETYPDRDELLSWFDVQPPCAQTAGRDDASAGKNCAGCAAAANCPSADNFRLSPDHD